MSDRLKTFAFFAAVAALWFLVPQSGFAQIADGTTDVPEPGSLSLLVGGVVAALYMARRRGK